MPQLIAIFNKTTNEKTMNQETIENTNKSKFWRNTSIFLAIVLALIIGGWLIFKFYLFPKQFSPVRLNAKEEIVLEEKLSVLGIDADLTNSNGPGQTGQALEPEAYSEKNAKREVNFSEKEINALLAKNTDLADKLAIDLSKDLISVKYLVPLEEDFPIMGGKTVKLNAGVEIAYLNQQPKIVIKGVSAMGVPIPNAWLGDLKNVDLIEKFGNNDGLMKSFADGVEFISVENGKINIKLKE